MSEISVLEGRITAALDRIRRGVEAQGQTSASDASLQSELEDERANNAALVERVKLLKERQDTQVASLTARVETQLVQMRKLDAELQSLRASNAQLREMNTQLRQTVTEGLAPELIDAAVAAEVDALQAQRSAEATEIETILGELKPLLEEASHAAD